MIPSGRVEEEVVGSRHRLVLREYETQVVVMSSAVARDLVRLAAGRLAVTPAPDAGTDTLYPGSERLGSPRLIGQA